MHFIISLLFGWSLNSLSAALSLESYLKQVESKNDGVKEQETLSQSYALRHNEYRLNYVPSFFSNIGLSIDQSPKIFPASQGTRTDAYHFNLGIQQLFPFGLKSKLYYDTMHTTIQNATFLPISDFYDGRWVLEFNLTLLGRNNFGQETNALIDAQRDSNKAKYFLETFSKKMSLIEAQVQYVKLSLIREIVQLQHLSVERAGKIEQWNDRRVRQNLADRSDLLQSTSARQLRELELQGSLNDEIIAASLFNSLRGVESSKVEEELTPLQSLPLETLTPPERKGQRGDTLAALYGKNANQLLAQSNREKNRYSLEVTGSLSTNGRSVTGFESAFSDSVTYLKPIYQVGLKLSVPLAFDLTSEVDQSYIDEASALELKHSRKLLEENVEWSNLILQFEDLKKRIDLAKQIENIQREKFINEKQRQSLGRSTTFLVLQFEQDLANSQLNLLKLRSEFLITLSRLKAFEPIKDL